MPVKVCVSHTGSVGSAVSSSAAMTSSVGSTGIRRVSAAMTSSVGSSGRRRASSSSSTVSVGNSTTSSSSGSISMGAGWGGKGVGNFLLGLGNLLSRQLKQLMFGGSLEGGKELSDEGRALFVLLHRPDHTVMDVLKGGVTGAAIGVGDRYVVAYLIAACVEDLEEGEIGLGGDLQG